MVQRLAFYLFDSCNLLLQSRNSKSSKQYFDHLVVAGIALSFVILPVVVWVGKPFEMVLIQKILSRRPCLVHFPFPHLVIGTTKHTGMSMCPGRSKKNHRRDLHRDIDVLMTKNTDVLISLVRHQELKSMGISHMLTAYVIHPHLSSVCLRLRLIVLFSF